MLWMHSTVVQKCDMRYWNRPLLILVSVSSTLSDVLAWVLFNVINGRIWSSQYYAYDDSHSTEWKEILYSVALQIDQRVNIIKSMRYVCSNFSQLVVMFFVQAENFCEDLNADAEEMA